MGYIYAFESIVYYFSLLLFARYILDCTPRKPILVLSFLPFGLILIAAWFGSLSLVDGIGTVIIFLQFPMIRWIFPNAKIRYTVFFFLLMDCINISIITTGIQVFGADSTVMDVTSNLLTAGIWWGICLSGLRHRLRQILLYTPKYVLFVSALLFIAMMMVDMTPFVSINSLQVRTRLQAAAVGLLQLAVCIAFPVFITVSSSNSRLKMLTVTYEQQIQAQAEHYKALSDANLEARQFRHDFKNTRIAIEKLLTDGDQAQALELLQKCGDSLNAPHRNTVLFDTGNPIADALLTDKQSRAAAHSTQIIFQGAMPQNALDPIDLCVILGNTVDNAIEACEKLPSGKDRTIFVTCRCSSGFLFLTVQNPTAEKVIIRDNHISTTKQDKTLHGFGLLSLQSVVQRYNGNVKLSATDTDFMVSINLCLTVQELPTPI